MFMNLIILLLTIFISISSQSIENEIPSLKFLILMQEDNQMISEILLNEPALNNTFQIEFKQYQYHAENNKILNEIDMCNLYKQGYNIILDITWNNWYFKKIYEFIEKLNILYMRIDMSVTAALRIIDKYLDERNATDLTIIFEQQSDIEKSVSYWAGRSNIRVVSLDGMNERTFDILNNTKFVPSFYVIVGNTKNVTIILRKFKYTKLLKFPERVVVFFVDFPTLDEIKNAFNGLPVSMISYDKKMCCNENDIQCNDCPEDFDIFKKFFKNLVINIVKNIDDLRKYGLDALSTTRDCSLPSKFPANLFLRNMKKSQQNIYVIDDNNIFRPQVEAVIEVGNNHGNFETLGKFNNKQGFILELGKILKPNKKFYRVATGIATPWIYRELDPESGMIRLSGYCIDLIEKLAEVMNFDYELLVTDGYYGVKYPNGSWNGLVGGLMTGKLDIVVAPMTMTAQREEAIDFVTPIFATTGITIVTRKPVVQSSLFKFLQVLTIEVWLTIIGALIITTLILWILDRYSPYSSRNYDYNQKCRDFNLIECFWFSITSFTPQGGGEAPMSLSGRVMAGTYWIFVVLILATFTANLSAFLTLERMQLQVPDYSLQQLIRQSRINYTTMKSSWPLAYFENMKNTENGIFDIWKTLALDKTTGRYRVWDYPIKEQYASVLKAIYETGPVQNVSEGYRKVLEHKDATFAFIHDYSEIRYAIARTCYLVEVGTPFAERPYAVAVQQGSKLLTTVGNAMLNLQKDGYFEFLKNKYWNNNLRGECPEDETAEGISVDSLGGIFITTIFLLTLSVLTLIAELFNIKDLILGNKINVSNSKLSNNENIVKNKDIFEANFKTRTNEIFQSTNKDNIFSINNRKFDLKKPEDKFKLKNKSFDKITLGSDFRPVVRRNLGNIDYSGNYIAVQSRRSIRYGQDFTGQQYLP